MPGSDPGKATGEGEEAPQIPKTPWEQGMPFLGIPTPGNEGTRRENGVIPMDLHFLGISEWGRLFQRSLIPWILGFVGFSNGAFGKTGILGMGGKWRLRLEFFGRNPRSIIFWEWDKTPEHSIPIPGLYQGLAPSLPL